jgi:hypothetical protein
MESDTGDPGREAERLEAALERIARAAMQRAIRGPEQEEESATAEVGARLDAIIAELRAALAGKPE